MHNNRNTVHTAPAQNRCPGENNNFSKIQRISKNPETQNDNRSHKTPVKIFATGRQKTMIFNNNFNKAPGQNT